MKIESVNILQLKPYHLNCKIHNRTNIEAIKISLNKFNQYLPLVVSKKNNEIIIGNGTFQALKELNFKFVDVIYLDLTEQQQKILNISDNKISQLSHWNENLLNKIENFSEQLKELLKFDDDFLKKFEKKQKNSIKKLDILENDVILNNDQKTVLVSKEKFIKCPCCGKEFLKP